MKCLYSNREISSDRRNPVSANRLSIRFSIGRGIASPKHHSRWLCFAGFGQASRTFELARRDVDRHLVDGPRAAPVFRHRRLRIGKRRLGSLPAKPRRRGCSIAPLAPPCPGQDERQDWLSPLSTMTPTLRCLKMKRSSLSTSATNCCNLFVVETRLFGFKACEGSVCAACISCCLLARSRAGSAKDSPGKTAAPSEKTHGNARA